MGKKETVERKTLDCEVAGSGMKKAEVLSQERREMLSSCPAKREQTGYSHWIGYLMWLLPGLTPPLQSFTQMVYLSDIARFPPISEVALKEGFADTLELLATFPGYLQGAEGGVLLSLY